MVMLMLMLMIKPVLMIMLNDKGQHVQARGHAQVRAAWPVWSTATWAGIRPRPHGTLCSWQLHMIGQMNNPFCWGNRGCRSLSLALGGGGLKSADWPVHTYQASTPWWVQV